MSNDNGLVDEFENLEKQKKELEQKEDDIKKKLIELAKQKNTEVLFGNHKKCFIKEYEKVIYPEDKSILTKVIKKKGLYEDLYQTIKYFRFSKQSNAEFEILKQLFSNELITFSKSNSSSCISAFFIC